MCLDMFLEILWSLESLSTELTLVWLQWNVDSNVRSNVVPLHSCSSTLSPRAGEVQVIGTLTADMAFTDVLLKYVSASRMSHVRAL